MDFFTQGQKMYSYYKLPLVYSGKPIVPGPTDGYYGLICAEYGTLEIEDETGTHQFPVPSIVFLRPGHTIRSIRVSTCEVHCCVFRPEAINTRLLGTPPRDISEMPEYFFYGPFARIAEPGYYVHALNVSLYRTIAYLGKKLDEKLNTAQTDSWPCLSRSYFLELLILLERSLHEKSFSPDSKGTDSNPLKPILEYIHTHYNADLSLDSIASRFATNRTTLNKRFNEICGMSTMAYINTVRLDVASTLLRDTTLSIAEITERTGFMDESYFARVFRKKIGTAPGTYRKSCPNPYHG